MVDSIDLFSVIGELKAEEVMPKEDAGKPKFRIFKKRIRSSSQTPLPNQVHPPSAAPEAP